MNTAASKFEEHGRLCEYGPLTLKLIFCLEVNLKVGSKICILMEKTRTQLSMPALPFFSSVVSHCHCSGPMKYQHAVPETC